MPQFETEFFIPQLFWLGVSFLLLYLGIQYFIEPKLRILFHKRHEQIQAKLSEIENLKSETLALRAVTDHLLKEARKENDTKLSHLKNILDKEWQRLQEKNHRISQEKLVQFEQEMKYKYQQILDQIKNDQSSLTQQLYDKITFSTLTVRDIP